MTFMSIIFILALAGIVLLIIIRSIELKTGKGIIARASVEAVVKRWVEAVCVRAQYVWDLVCNFVLDIPYMIMSLPRVTKRIMYRKFQRHIDLIKGRGVLHTKGSVPVFFSQVSKHKEDLRN